MRASHQFGEVRLEPLDKRAFERNPPSVDALGQVFFLVSVKQRTVDGNHAWLLESKLQGGDGFEYRLVRIADVGPLLDLDHIEVFQHLESVSAGDQQDDVAGAEYPTCAVFLFPRVEIDAHLPLSDE